MKRILMALAIILIPVVLCATETPQVEEPEDTVVGVAAEADSIPCGQTVARDLGDRYEGPGISEFPDDNPPCPPNG
jgi:hypothetical protein